MKKVSRVLARCTGQSSVPCIAQCLQQGFKTCVCVPDPNPYKALSEPVRQLITFQRELNNQFLDKVRYAVDQKETAIGLCEKLVQEEILIAGCFWHIVECWRMKSGECFERVLEDHELVVDTYNKFTDYMKKTKIRIFQYNLRCNHKPYQMFEDLSEEQFEKLDHQDPFFASNVIRSKLWGTLQAVYFIREKVIYKSEYWEAFIKTLPRECKKSINYPFVEHYEPIEIPNTKAKEYAKIKDYTPCYFVPTDSVPTEIYIVLLRPSSASDKELVFKVYTEEQKQKWIDNMRLAKYGKQLRENYVAYKAKQELARQQNIPNLEPNECYVIHPWIKPTEEQQEIALLSRVQLTATYATIEIMLSPKARKKLRSRENHPPLVLLGPELRANLTKLNLLSKIYHPTMLPLPTPDSETTSIEGDTISRSSDPPEMIVLEPDPVSRSSEPFSIQSPEEENQSSSHELSNASPSPSPKSRQIPDPSPKGRRTSTTSKFGSVVTTSPREKKSVSDKSVSTSSPREKKVVASSRPGPIPSSSPRDKKLRDIAKSPLFTPSSSAKTQSGLGKPGSSKSEATMSPGAKTESPRAKTESFLGKSGGSPSNPTGARKKTKEFEVDGKSKGLRKKRDDDSVPRAANVKTTTPREADKLASHVPMDFTGKVGKIVEDPEEARKIAEGSDCGQRSLRPIRCTRPTGQPEEPQVHLSEPWFHNVPREEANRMLLRCQDEDPDGLFIVRPSRTIPGHYVVSYRHRRTIHHVQIIAKYDRIGQLWTYTIDNGLRKFKDLIMIVKYLQNNTAGLYCRMTQYLARNEAFDEPNAPSDTPEYKVVQLSALYKTYNLPISPTRSTETTSPKLRHYQD